MISEIIDMLQADDANALFGQARSLATRKELLFSKRIPLTSTCTMDPICRHCSWQPFRHLSTGSTQSAMTPASAVIRAKNIERAGIQRCYFPSGWMGFEVPHYFYECISAVRENTSLELFGESGAISRQTLQNMKAAGMDGYIIGVETTNEALFRWMRPGEDYQRRIQTIWDAKEIGLKVLTTFLVGIGETVADLGKTIEYTRQLDIDSIHVLPFMPCPFTDMEKRSTPNHYWSAKVTAVTRITNPAVNLYAFGTQLWHEAAWAVRAGSNAFWVSYNCGENDAAYDDDELVRLKNIFK